uniref:RING-type E3 ubiquitin transferase n=1 Tax=Callorhinchus milii TaxID=7868 RepID=A0A4W3HIL0_CALMI
FDRLRVTRTSRHQVQALTEKLNCVICLECSKVPVCLDCGHKYCRSCITGSREKQGKPSRPEYRQVTAKRNLKFNWPQAKIMAVERQCEKHREDLKLFCEDDKKLICSICRDAKEHKGHSFLPIDEAVEIYKVPRASRGIHSVSTEEQVKSVQTHVKAEFAKMHQSLTDREQRVMVDLRQREEEILKRMETSLREIQGKLESVEQELSELQTQMGKDALTFLQVKR